MFIKTTISILLLITLMSCTTNQSTKEPVVLNLQEKTQTNTIKIIFNDGVCLIWDTFRNKLVEDSAYIQLANDINKCASLAAEISDTTDLKVDVCTKKSTLKKGDVAFLYLYSIGKVSLFSCLKIQFDVQNENCKIPNNVLDYVEIKRKEVEHQVKDCLNK